MTSRFNPLAAYGSVANAETNPMQQVVMLYDGAIRFLERARVGFQYEDPLEFNLTINNNLLKAQAILTELNTSLNMEQGQECAANLRRLYDYLDRRLQESNQHKEEKGILEVIRRLTLLRDAWAEMLQNSGGPTGPLNPSEKQEPFSVAV